MRSFLQTGLITALSLSMLYAYYQKRTEESKIAEAIDIAVDSVYYTNQENLTKNVQVVSNPAPFQESSSLPDLSVLDTPAPKSTGIMKRKIEVFEVKKPKASDLSTRIVMTPELPESASAQPTPVTTEPKIQGIEVTPAAEITPDQTGQTEKKKKFLFFNKKNKAN